MLIQNMPKVVRLKKVDVLAILGNNLSIELNKAVIAKDFEFVYDETLKEQCIDIIIEM